jgi:putative DNA primase/helicase
MTLGAPAGAAVRLGRGRGPLIICEGIETCLSCMQLWGLPGWSALCANGVASLAIEGLPDEIVIAADNDPAGRRAAGDLHQRVNATGRRASVLIPEARLKDFNDVLRSTVSARRTR